jgi:Tol biopolymer transport system component
MQTKQRPMPVTLSLLVSGILAACATGPATIPTPTTPGAPIASASASPLVESTPTAPATASPLRLGAGIVFERELSADANELVWTDGITERTILASSVEGQLSPDGRRFIDTTPAANGVGASTFGFDGGKLTPLPNPAGIQLDGYVAWSPDGTRVVGYGYSETDQSVNGLYARDADGGGNLVRLTKAGDRLEHPLWYSPDGKWLLFSRRLEPGVKHGAPQDLFVVSADGGKATRLNPPNTSVGLYWSIKPATWSPDGSRIASAVHSDDPELAGIWVVDADGSNAHRITAIRTDQYTYAHWSPDGAWIAMAPALIVEVVRPDGTDRHVVIGVERQDQWFGGIWSPDGTQLLSSHYGDVPFVRADLWVVGIDGSGAAAVTHHPGTYTNLAWVPG